MNINSLEQNSLTSSFLSEKNLSKSKPLPIVIPDFSPINYKRSLTKKVSFNTNHSYCHLPNEVIPGNLKGQYKIENKEDVKNEALLLEYCIKQSSDEKTFINRLLNLFDLVFDYNKYFTNEGFDYYRNLLIKEFMSIDPIIHKHTVDSFVSDIEAGRISNRARKRILQYFAGELQDYIIRSEATTLRLLLKLKGKERVVEKCIENLEPRVIRIIGKMNDAFRIPYSPNVETINNYLDKIIKYLSVTYIHHRHAKKEHKLNENCPLHGKLYHYFLIAFVNEYAIDSKDELSDSIINGYLAKARKAIALSNKLYIALSRSEINPLLKSIEFLENQFKLDLLNLNTIEDIRNNLTQIQSFFYCYHKFGNIT